MLAFADATRAELLFVEPGGAAERSPHPFEQQLREGLAGLGIDLQGAQQRSTCGACANFRRTPPTKCTWRDLWVEAGDISCDWFIAVLG
jgi:hypothetical protein